MQIEIDDVDAFGLSSIESFDGCDRQRDRDEKMDVACTCIDLFVMRHGLK